MRREPGTHQGGHQRLVVDLRLEEIDTDENEGEDRGETQDPFIAPAAVDHDTHQRQEERIPKPGFALCTQRRTFQRQPHSDDESRIHQKTQYGEAGYQPVPAFPGEDGADDPAYGG